MSCRKGRVCLSALVLSVVGIPHLVVADTLLVPQQFDTLQAAVNGSQHGDTILVAPGVYTGEGNRDISLFGKAIHIKSVEGPEATVIDCEGSPPNDIHRAFYLVHGESRHTVIEGFTIRNAYLIGDTGGTGVGGGGAVYIRDSSPTIRDCIITQNVSAALSPPFPVDGRGAGIYVDGNSSALIERCTIVHNTAERHGGGVLVGYINSRVVIRDCLIGHNTASNGGAVFFDMGELRIENTTLVGNEVVFSGGGLGVVAGLLVLKNSIVWGNTISPKGAGPQLSVSGTLWVEHALVEGGIEDAHVCCGANIEWDGGSSEQDPQFIDANLEDYRLSNTSPCIDAGKGRVFPHPGLDLDGNYRFVDVPSVPNVGDQCIGAVDIGAYEYQHSGVVVASDPPHLSIDVGQPSPLSGARVQGVTDITLQFSGELPEEVGDSDFDVLVTGGLVPQITSVTASPKTASVIVHLDKPQASTERMTIRHIATGSGVTLGSLPGDVDSNGVTDMYVDTFVLLDYLAGAIPEGSLQPWQCDVNRSGVCEPRDILRFIDLINCSVPHYLTPVFPDYLTLNRRHA